MKLKNHKIYTLKPLRMKNLLLLFTILAVFSSCKDNKYTVSGNFENAAGQTIVLERLNLASTVVIDSMKIEKDGSFKFSAEKLTEPTFFQLTVKPNKTLNSRDSANMESH